MTGTREQEIQNHNSAAPAKVREGARPDSHPCGGCNACHQMTRIQASSKIMGWPGEGAEGPTLQKACATNFFQRNLGNSYMQSLADRHTATGDKATGGGAPAVQRKCDCGGSCESCAGKEDETGKIQTKLAIGAPDDVYEQEADRVAEQIVGIASSAAVSRKSAGSDYTADPGATVSSVQIQRQEQERELVEPPDEISLQLPAVSEVEDEVMTKPCDPSVQSGKEPPVAFSTHDTDIHAQVNSAIAGGSTFDHPVKSTMERHLGVDLSEVKIHTDSQADNACRAVNARAFTLGQHIAFSKGEYQPNSSEGSHLIAHELTHVVQQSEGLKQVVRRQASCPPGSALPYAGYSDPSHNCYAYALNTPSAGMITPGYTSGSPYGGMNLWDKNTYTVDNVRTLTEGDLGGGCSGCCSSGSTRMIVEVATNNATHVASRALPGGRLAPVPKVGSKFFDFHWYRQDADGLFSHKPGRGTTSREDAAAAPISDPHTASRSYSYADYGNIVANWCV